MTKPGFIRVFIPSRNKTTRIRSGLANNPNYLERNGMVLMPAPVAPPPPVAPTPIPPPAPTELYTESAEVTPAPTKPTITKAKPTKTK